jgi:chemotaxis protein MotA
MTWIIGLSTLGFFLFKEFQTNELLFNTHSIILVGGGTLAVVMLLSSKAALRDIFKLMFSSFREEHRMDADTFKTFIKDNNANVSDPYGLIRYARDVWMVGVGKEEFEQLITFKAQSVLNQNMSAISVLRNLGKYPPALGMIGTVLGMIQLFKGLSSGDSNIGFQLAVAMTATFYGLILSNLLILPLADRLEAKEEERRANLEQHIKVLITIHHQQPMVIVEGVLDVA